MAEEFQTNHKPQTSEIEIRLAMEAALDGFEPFHNQILLGIFMRGTAKEIAGGHKLYLPESVVREDQFQGKVGVVLKIGPLAFKSDGRNDFGGQNIQIGDWVVFRVNNGFTIDINKVHCRMIEDVHVYGRVADPMTIW